MVKGEQLVMSYSILYLSYDGLTDPLGQSQILPYIIGLEAKGFEFTIISFEKPEAFKKVKEEVDNGLAENIKWIPLPYHKNPPVLSTLLAAWLLWRVVIREHRKKPFDIVHCRSYITSLVGLRMKRKMGVRFIFDMRGFWADERIEGGLWNLKNQVFNTIYKYFKKREKEFLLEADHVISLTENAKLEILSWGLKAAPITVIPTCVDLELFDPEKINKENQAKLREQLGIKPDDFVLLYLGSLGTWYMLSEMFDFFNTLNQKSESAKFLIVTPDSEDKIRDVALARKVDINRIIVKKALRNEVPLYISIARCSILFIRPTFSKRASSPTKLGEVLSMGIPVVANASVGDNDLLFASGDIGVLIKDFNTEDYQETVNQILGVKERNNANIRDFALQKLSLSMGVDLYERVYKELL